MHSLNSSGIRPMDISNSHEGLPHDDPMLISTDGLMIDRMEIVTSGEFPEIHAQMVRRGRVWNIRFFPGIAQSMDASTTVKNDMVLQGDIVVERGPQFSKCVIEFVGEIRMVGGDSSANNFTVVVIYQQMANANIPNWLATLVCRALPYARNGFHWKEHLPAAILAHFLNRRVFLYNSPDTAGEYAVYSRNIQFGNEGFDLDVCALLTPDQYRDTGFRLVVVQVNGAAFHLNASVPRKPLKDAMLRHICDAHEVLLIEIYTPNVPVSEYPNYIYSRLVDVSQTLVMPSTTGLHYVPLMRCPWENCGFTVTPGPGG